MKETLEQLQVRIAKELREGRLTKKRALTLLTRGGLPEVLAIELVAIVLHGRGE